MTLVQQVEIVVDLARRITLVVRTDKNVLNISIVNRFFAFPQNIQFDHLLVVSVLQIAFCLSCHLLRFLAYCIILNLKTSRIMFKHDLLTEKNHIDTVMNNFRHVLNLNQ